ncbi:hypothetical protein FF38_00681 [Lucilia cuprina]|uniref:CHK kinase-like domain-containing protein n=1 Tax=Lucilia cuprina TaxID=7375 RepID=A0A0L0BQ72_LUCCU|nr:hypothetical protein CVS40_5939 [Lucilia cuprina]KNC22156.1 hypothetical protein FF38_00681 [Lucilia cuprina]
MSDSNNNSITDIKQNNNSSSSALNITGNSEILTKFSPKIFETYKKLALERGILSYELNARPVSGVGENSYGFILQVCIKATKMLESSPRATKSFVTILKISPKNPAFRAHSRIVDLYRREVFMYQQVFKEFRQLELERLNELKCINDVKLTKSNNFDIVPDILYANLDLQDEFIIFEDLTLSDFKQNSRTNMPSYDLVSATFRSIAKMHAMSFVLQYRKPELFKRLTQQMSDNLFTADMEPLTVEFGKRYIRRTRAMLELDSYSSSKQIEALKHLECNFKDICLQCVDGQRVAPYAVLCHGDFWNNNILYKYDAQQQATSAKLIDFQLSRYASPILDLVHYLFACTERDLRSKHFMEFMDIYHQSLSQHIEFYGHNVEEIYPKTIFLQHLKEFGIYGFCMAAFSIPFFISNTSELPDFDEVAGAIREISSSENSDEEIEGGNEEKVAAHDATTKRLELLEEYDLLSERTLPIFKRRMCGIVKDLEKYEMLGYTLKL